MLRSQRGFTLIELLVVILIVAVLAAIAIPMFVRHRSKAQGAQMQSALRNATIAIESYGVANNGFGGLNANPQLRNRLAEEGFLIPDWADPPGYFRIVSTTSTYCIEARHNVLAAGDPWRDATYRMAIGHPEAVPDTCP